jgi:hypothetical protein
VRILLLALGLLVAALAAALGVAAYRWRSGTASLVARLRQQSVTPLSATYSESELEGLPQPVASYFRAVLHPGQAVVRHARFVQSGQFLVRPTSNGWRPFSATHDLVTHPGGFVWNASIRMAPGITIRVRDGFVGGTGFMVASLMGLRRLASVEGTPDIAEGALHRYLAEAVWCPTALLPSQGVAWSAVDDSTARATDTVSGTTVSLDFHFGADGLVSRVYTAARAREVNGRGVPTPWQGRFSRYEERGGMRIPLEGEVEWVLPEGPQPYWRGTITDVVFDP